LLHLNEDACFCYDDLTFALIIILGEKWCRCAWNSLVFFQRQLMRWVVHRFVQKKITEKQIQEGKFMDDEGAYPKCMGDVFCSTSMLQNTPYMARGIYEDDDGKDQNHTFCAIGHERGNDFFFSIVECVTPILVLQEHTSDDCEHRQNEFAHNYGTRTQMHVLNKTMMAKRYKHILWVGSYMVFECIAATESKHAYISYGAGSYHTYSGESIYLLMHLLAALLCL